MDLPKRKLIRLGNYDYSQNNVYYITICTYNRSQLFGEMVGANLRVRPNNPDKLIEKWLFELQNKYINVNIDKITIMPDHIHFILRQTGEHAGSPLPEIIKWYKTQTTNEYIKGVKNGLFPPFEKHIWQRNYYEHIIRNQEDYNAIWQYIDDNLINAVNDKENEPKGRGEPTCSLE